MPDTRRVQGRCSRVKISARFAWPPTSTLPSTSSSAMSAPSGNAVGTPIKAITSSLASRAAPSIPSAAQVYEPLLKSVLRRRLLSNVFIVSASFCWVLAAVWTSWQMGGVDKIGVKGWIANVFNPLTLLFAALWWAAACIPITVLRRTYITCESRGASPCIQS